MTAKPEQSSPEAVRLRALIMKIRGMFSDIPAVQRLPHSEVVCL
jgi:hypothetical protein